jgi:hypothetical protein
MPHAEYTRSPIVSSNCFRVEQIKMFIASDGGDTASESAIAGGSEAAACHGIERVEKTSPTVL